jgi:hypothetical protein
MLPKILIGIFETKDMMIVQVSSISRDMFHSKISGIMVNVSSIKMEEEETSSVMWVGEKKLLEFKGEKRREMINVVVMKLVGEEVDRDGSIEII